MEFGKINQISRVYGERRERGVGFDMGDYHAHHFYELYYVERGACQFFIDDNLYRLPEGYFLLIPPEYLHYTKYKERCLRFSVYFREQDPMGEVLALLQERQCLYQPTIFKIPPEKQEEIGTVLREMEQAEEGDPHFLEAEMRLLLNRLLLLVLQRGEFSDPLRDRVEIYSEDQGILSAARYIAAHFDEKLDQRQLAEISGYSPNYFSMRFKETTGIGAHEYLKLLRLRKARELLRDSGQSILQIALAVGYNDGNYFKDAFKKQYGLSPRAWRRQNESTRRGG